MRVWKQSAIAVSIVVGASLVQAEPATAADTRSAKTQAAKPKKHLVDMADGMNQRDFYEAKNPEAIWSTEGGSAPWTRAEAINAWEQTGGKSSSGVREQDLQAGTERPAAVPLLEDGKPVEAGRSINIRVRYTLDPEHSKASYSPVSAQAELYRQMGSHCGNGFQKMSEWSTPVEGSDYYLYYQFRCMDIPAQ